jgi:radical SAM protein with 4Fe4S-binding SPASM domain
MTEAVSHPRLVRHTAPELDRYLFFNPASARSVVTNSRGASIIDAYLHSPDDEHVFIRNPALRGLFASAGSDKTYGRVPDRLIVELTAACNLRCKTCYMIAAKADENELGTEEVKRLMEEAASAGTRTVALMGGEPFLREDLWPLVDDALERFEQVQISTNGTLMDGTSLSRYAGNRNLMLQVSLDGPDAQSNDAIRGKGNFGKASAFLEFAAGLGIPVSISAVLNKHNYNLVGRLCDFASEKGCSLAIFHKVHVFGRAEKSPAIIPSKAELMHAMEVLLNKFYEYERQGRMSVDFPHNRCFRGDMALDACFPGCHFGRAFAFVTSCGNLVCCSHLREGDFVYGNVRERGLLDIWRMSAGLEGMRQLKVDDIPSCKECQFKYMCRASCRADALGHAGELTGDPYDCEALKAYYLYVLEHMVRNIEPIIPEEG